MDAVTGSLIVFVVLFFMNPSMKLFLLIWKLAISRMQPKPDDLKTNFGDWAVVTGSTDGVGKEYAKELAKRDINLVLISRSMEKLKKTKDEIQMLNFNIHIKVIQADFSKGQAEFERIRNNLKDIPVAILINNVGKATEYPMYFGEITENNLWDMININIGATTQMTHLVIEQMKRRGKGAIVNICCGADRAPAPLMSVYAASKTFLRYFSDAIRDEYAQHGLTVQRLSPFYLNTKMTAFSRIVPNHRTLFPNAATYVKNAIKTLGKLDSATGYWAHDLLQFFMSMLPMLLRRRFNFMTANFERNAYLKSLQEKVIEE